MYIDIQKSNDQLESNLLFDIIFSASPEMLNRNVFFSLKKKKNQSILFNEQIECIFAKSRIDFTLQRINTKISFFSFPIFKGGHHVQHSYPVLVQRRGQGRRLPPTPCKPSTLQLKPSNINFPKLNASPTHVCNQKTEKQKTNEFFTIFKSNFLVFFSVKLVLFSDTSFDAT